MTDWEDRSLDGATLAFAPAWLAREVADAWLDALLGEVAWRTERLRVFGREHVVPRRVAFQGDEGVRYRYSGRDHRAAPWTPTVRAIRDALRETLREAPPDTLGDDRGDASPGVDFDGALLNLYRDGADAMGWHADDEPELGARPVIASISLGAPRAMRFRRRRGDAWETATIELPHGSLLVMAGDTQSNWQHALPRRARVTEPRVNATFRRFRDACGEASRPV